jgi:hypothetical protein
MFKFDTLTGLTWFQFQSRKIPSLHPTTFERAQCNNFTFLVPSYNPISFKVSDLCKVGNSEKVTRRPAKTKRNTATFKRI